MKFKINYTVYTAEMVNGNESLTNAVTESITSEDEDADKAVIAAMDYICEGIVNNGGTYDRDDNVIKVYDDNGEMYEEYEFKVEVDERTIEEKILDTTRLTRAEKKTAAKNILVYGSYEEFLDTWVGGLNDEEDAPEAWDDLEIAEVDGVEYRFDWCL